MKDLLLTDAGELEISNGDFVAGENYNQQQATLLVAHEGEFKMTPTIGVGIGREGQKQFLSYCIDLFRQALLLNYQTEKLVYLEPEVEGFKLEKFAPFVTGNNITEIFKELSDASYHIERNGNAKIILTDLSIKLTRLIHKNA